LWQDAPKAIRLSILQEFYPAAVTIAREVESDPAKAAIAVTYLNIITNAKQAYFEANRTDAAGFKKAEDDLMLNYEGAALDGLLKLRTGLPVTVEWVGRDIYVNNVTLDGEGRTAVLTTDESWAGIDQAEKYLFSETSALHTVEMRMVTKENGGEGWIVSEVS
jgi:hypothetical protein